MKAADVMPWSLARILSKKDPYDWQKKVQADVMRPGCVALRAANESGKTTGVAAWVVLSHAILFPKGKIICTSGSWRQVENQLMPAISQHGKSVQGLDFTKTGFTTKQGGMCVGFSTNDAGKFEGWHSDGKEAPLLMILDEAKTIPDEIFQAVERCRPDRLLIMSSPGKSSGFFYECFNRMATRFKQHVVTAYDCPHISKEKIESQIASWGKDHPLVRSSIFGDFMLAGDGEEYVFDFNRLEALIRQPPAWVNVGEPVAFCDFAAGGDENVFSVKRGNKIGNLICWRDRDTMAAVGRFICEFRKAGLQSNQIWGDVGGVGAAMCDALREAGWDINRMNNGEAAHDPTRFANRGAEVWFETSRLVDRGEIALPDDVVLKQQLTTRLRRVDSKGRLHLEKKDELRARGLSSPDRADAVCGACGNVPFVIGNAVKESPWDSFDDLNFEPKRETEGALAGAWAGM